MELYRHGPMDFAKTPKLRFRVGDLDLPERRKRYTSSREEEEIDAQMCPCGKAIESRTHIVGECEICKEERDVLEEEMREIGECDMEEFGTPDSSEKTIDILGDPDGGHRRPNRKGIRIAKNSYVIYGNNVINAQLLGVSLLGVETVLRLERDAWSMVK